MRKITALLLAVFCMAALLFAFFVLQDERALVMHPKGMVARKELELIQTNTFLMLLILLPTFFLILSVAWKYRAGQKNRVHEPDTPHSLRQDLLLWLIPSVVVAVISVILWNATHELDPYTPLKSDVPVKTIQVVALDWKWLFIYPEEGIATVGFVQFPEKAPIRFELAADGSPMNSFWIPSLSGQIYCMAGMITPLHVIADGPGTYAGRASEINGEGYAKMTFVAESKERIDFETWVAEVKNSSLTLDSASYEELVKPSIGHPTVSYATVEKDLFQKIVGRHGHCGH